MRELVDEDRARASSYMTIRQEGVFANIYVYICGCYI